MEFVTRMYKIGLNLAEKSKEIAVICELQKLAMIFGNKVSKVSKKDPIDKSFSTTKTN